MRTTAGKTLTYLEEQRKAEQGSRQKISANRFKHSLMYASFLADIVGLENFIQIRNSNLALPGFSISEVEKLLYYICTK